MTREYQDTGASFINETSARQYQDAGGSFINETSGGDLPPNPEGVLSGAGEASADFRSPIDSAQVHVIGALAHETGLRQAMLPQAEGLMLIETFGTEETTISAALSAAGEATGSFVGAAQAAGVLSGPGEADATFTGAPLGVGVLDGAGEATATFDGASASDGVGVLAGAGEATATFVGEASTQSSGVLGGVGEATGIFVGHAIAAAVLAAVGEATFTAVAVGVPPVYGWGARGRIGAESARDPYSGIGTGHANDGNSGIGSDLA